MNESDSKFAGATSRPWSLNVEVEGSGDEDGLTIVIPEIGRCLHDWEWADASDWTRDLANAELIVAAVNCYDSTQRELGRLRRVLARAESLLTQLDHHLLEQNASNAMRPERQQLLAQLRQVAGGGK
jgi:hypothetical protein